MSIVYFDVTANRKLFDRVVQTNGQLESAYEELQSTNEELETTNEELQSTVEELETTNEELQSTNEELETMNEELQSTNDELHTINDTLRERSLELDDARNFLTSLANSIGVGLLVVDREMRVIAWNRGCEELWGLRSDEAVGAVLLTLDIGLPVEQLKPLIGSAFVGQDASGEITVSAGRDDRGRRLVVAHPPDLQPVLDEAPGRRRRRPALADAAPGCGDAVALAVGRRPPRPGCRRGGRSG